MVSSWEQPTFSVYHSNSSQSYTHYEPLRLFPHKTDMIACSSLFLRIYSHVRELLPVVGFGFGTVLVIARLKSDSMRG